jgi:ferredoxin-NADP reductase
MEEYKVKIIKIERVTHNVRRYRLEKPEGYSFVPGQATDVSIDSARWKDEKRPFTFTCLNEDPYLEFTIKSYTDHDGVTNALGTLEPGAGLIIRDVWGAISYKGPGVFIAGGAGITPFIAIFRQLNKARQLSGNQLIFSNRTAGDIIMKDEFTAMLGMNFLNTLTGEDNPLYEHRHIDEAFLKDHISDFSGHFYICGPDPFVLALTEILGRLGADPDAVVFEK